MKDLMEAHMRVQGELVRQSILLNDVSNLSYIKECIERQLFNEVISFTTGRKPGLTVLTYRKGETLLATGYYYLSYNRLTCKYEYYE